MVDEAGITENIIGAELAAHGHKLTYFERRGELEIDFILNLGGDVAAIEVKSGKHTRSKSLDSIVQNYQTVLVC